MKINLIYFKDSIGYGNFGDELSVFVTQKITGIGHSLFYNNESCGTNLMVIGSYLHMAKEGTFIYGSGVRSDPPIENGHGYRDLKVCAVRGPITRDFLLHRGIGCPEIYGDPALLMPLFYSPRLLPGLRDKIAVVPHKSQYGLYSHLGDDYVLVNPTGKWRDVIDTICSCRSVISSSLHGLICSDAYGMPNVWLYEHEMVGGDLKFKDYLLSQGRPLERIEKIGESFDSWYNGGNMINMEKLLEAYPFR